MAVVLLAGEEEKLVLSVHHVRDEDRAAEIPPVIVVAVERSGESFCGATPEVVSVGVRVHAVVAPEVAKAAVVLVGAPAGSQRDNTSARPAILRLVVRGHYLDFLERVRVNRHQRPGVVAEVQVRYAVNGVLVLEAARAVDLETAGDVGHRGSRVGHQGAHVDAGNELHHVDDVLAVQCDVPNVPVRQHVGALARFGLNLDRPGIRFDRHGLGDAAYLKDDVAHADLGGNRQDDVFVLALLEALSFRGDVVGPRRKVKKNEVSFPGGRYCLVKARTLFEGRHGRSGNHRAAGILDRPGDRTAVLRKSRTRQEGKHDEGPPHTPYVSHHGHYPFLIRCFLRGSFERTTGRVDPFALPRTTSGP